MMWKIYTAEWCDWCKKVKAALALRGIDFEEADVDKDMTARAEFQAAGHKTLPQIYHNGRHIGGHDQTLVYLETL